MTTSFSRRISADLALARTRRWWRSRPAIAGCILAASALVLIFPPYASLTLGGYDTNKYEANNITFIFAPDNEHDTMVAIQSITTPSRDDANPLATEMLPSKVYALIDATVPELWLPIEACAAFEYEFGLMYDNETDLYLINDTQHEILKERNASVTLKLGQGPDSSATVSIVLPYAAFDLRARPPFRNIANESYYFPIRRANSSQTTLGRTFLQEAYIIVDYEVSRFQLGQVVWDQTTSQNLKLIPPANASNDASLWTSPSWDQGSSERAPGSAGNSSLLHSESDSSGLASDTSPVTWLTYHSCFSPSRDVRVTACQKIGKFLDVVGLSTTSPLGSSSLCSRERSQATVRLWKGNRVGSKVTGW